MKKKIVVLDVGGVLATNLKPKLWHKLAELSNTTSDELYTAYKQQISERLWTNEVNEQQFWSWLEQYHIHLTKKQQQAIINQTLQPLPAITFLQTWSLYAELHIMSNHLHDWLEPVLAPYAHNFTAIHISSRYGMKKPSIQWYNHIHEQLPADSSIWFVDDSPANLLAAEQLGWNTILADEKYYWIIELTKKLTK